MWQARKERISKQTKHKAGSWKKLKEPAKAGQQQGYLQSPGPSFVSMAFLLEYAAFLSPLRSCPIPDGLGRWPLMEIDRSPPAEVSFQNQVLLLTNLILSLKNAWPSQADGFGQASPTLALR